MKNRVFLVTKKPYAGFQRKIGWFARYPNGIYFDIFGLIRGSHTSYHSDGSIWRTGLNIENKPEKKGNYLPLTDFQGLHQIGISIVDKTILPRYPTLKNRDINKALEIIEVDVEKYPSEILNIVVEFLNPLDKKELDSFENKPPKNSIIKIVKSFQPWIVLTILGYRNNILVEIMELKIIVHHFNQRYTANRKGAKYHFEAIGH